LAHHSKDQSKSVSAQIVIETKSDRFGRFAASASTWLGWKRAFMGAILIIAIWAISGPLFRFSNTWQLVINTSTTIVTF
jgi:low affinity Fe/Cu permease